MYNKEIQVLEDKFISKKNRFNLSPKELIELKKNFSKANILVVGAAGSIGNIFVEKLNKFNFSNLYLLDKDENRLTELSRKINIEFSKKKINKINYYCSDICGLDISKEIKDKKITHYFNFAAVKHVRSEENLLSIKYMVKTNSLKFIEKNLSKKNNLKQVFSISTDKSANPSSILGVTKKLMEYKLCDFKKKNKNIFVSSVRFANVSFSNGSILKYIIDRINQKIIFGIPKYISRYFITHNEASSLCFKSLLKENNNCILIPSYRVLGDLINIQEITERILKFKGYKPDYKNKKINVKKNKFPVIINIKPTHGQKEFEELHEKNEIIIKDKKEKNLYKVKLTSSKNYKKIINIFLNTKDKKTLLIKLKKYFPNIYTGNNRKMVSKII